MTLTHGEDNRVPPHTLMMDVTMTHHRVNGTLTQVSSTGDPQSDSSLNNSTRIKIRHYRQLYPDRSDPIDFLTVVMRPSGRVYDDFVRLIFFHPHHEVSILTEELPEDQFRFL